MSIDLTFLGHAGILLSASGCTVAIDPFLTGNPVAVQKPEDIKAQHIVLTHGHEDHVGDTVAIAQANNATVYGAFELCSYLGEQGCQTSPGNPGGKITTDFGYVAFTQAFHSSSYNGQYMGMPCGVVVRIGDRTIYHCGDTALFSDMRLIGEIYKPDVACIPCGDRFTMGPELAKKAAEFIGAPQVVPIHFKTWPLLAQDISALQPNGIEVNELQPGETLTV